MRKKSLVTLVIVSLFSLFGCTTTNNRQLKHFVIDDEMMLPIIEECYLEINDAIMFDWNLRKVKPSILIDTCYDERFGKGIVTVISHWIQETLFTDFVSSKNYKIIDRQDIERLRNEKKFQQAGYVDDKVMVDEGRELGGNYLITFKISEYDTFDSKVTNLETMEIIYTTSKQIKDGVVK